ncbi:NAD+ synthase [Kushneria aurantia]|uniref:Glutamine-dependent NAD(+) synthetase n=1 Tax=Kushneria aurantia TaxID=504092 RepID=A0ABV6FYS4_9GAMM|nr:NAD+ synthase [Kushneria aurantia]
MQELTLVMAQLDPLTGDIPGNAERAIEAVREAKIEHGADVVVLPELFLAGYPPEDLLLRESMAARIEQARQRMAEKTVRDVLVLVGYPAERDGRRFNMAGALLNGEWRDEYAKRALPNYRVFDEKRYFEVGDRSCVIEHRGIRLGVLICEDLWVDEPIADTVAAGAEVIVSLNASPWHRGKSTERVELFAESARRAQCPLIYVNQIGGQDELVFDGASFALDAGGECRVQALAWQPGLMPIRLTRNDDGGVDIVDGELMPLPATAEESLYCALVTGVRDYVNKSGFHGVVLGLSGGIDSALSLAIAVDALGPDRVQAVMMPYHYTAEISREDAAEQARTLGVHYEVLEIAPMVEAFTATLAASFEGSAADTTEENLQSRIRGTLLMALSNKKGLMVLTTGNKSEMAVGYATLYGDMVGGYNALKDVYKTWVYRLARWRNRQALEEGEAECVPARVIERPPSAELSEDQLDSDSLPDYDVLDEILERYIEGDQSQEAIIAAGFDRDAVEKVVKLVDRTEYKRRQAPPGVRATLRGFGRDRRYPIVNGWQPGD